MPYGTRLRTRTHRRRRHAAATARRRAVRWRLRPARRDVYPALAASRALTIADPDPEEERAALELEAIFRAHYGELYALVYRYVRSRALAEEIIQDAFLAVWRKRRRWSAGVDVKAYVFATARNRALNHLRRQRLERSWQQLFAARREEWGMSQFTSEAREMADVDELIEKMRRVVSRLPKRVRRTIILRLQWHLTNGEIAEVMGITLKAVERNIGRALKALREELGGQI